MAGEEGFHIASAFVTVEPDAADFKEKLKAAIDEAVAGTDATVKVKGDIADLKSKVGEAKGELDDLAAKKAEPHLSADIEQMRAAFDEADAKLAEFDGKEAKAKLGADDEELKAKADAAKAKLDEVGGKKAEATIDADDAPLDAKVAHANEELDKLGSKKVSPTISANESGGGGMLAGITGGLAALMPGLGGAATGLGLLGGVGALAFGGVAKAVSAAHQAAQNIGMTQQQLASTEFTNSVAIQNAQAAVGQAHMQAAQDAVQSSMQIRQAQQSVGQAEAQAAQDAVSSAAQIRQSQMQLAETERNAAASMIAAQQAVAASEHGLAEAQFGEQQAQYNLTQARITARQTLEELNNAEKDAALSTKSAILSVQQAKYQQTLTDQNAYSTSLDRQQAALAVAQAEQQVTDAKTSQQVATQKANLANSQGVNGQQAVILAQHALKDAIYGVSQAQQQEQNAARALRDTQLNNATAVKEATMAVAAAQRQAAFQAQNDARAVQAAEQNLAAAREQGAYTAKRDAIATAAAQQNVTNTIKAQRLAWAATMSAQNQAALQFAKDMARLTPAGREMVREILSMRGAWRGLLDAAQTAVAPGIDVFLRGIKSLMPEITAGVRSMGRAIGDVFGQIGKSMQTAGFRQVLQGLISNGIQFVRTVLPAFGGLVAALARLGSAKGAVSGLANVLAGVGNGLTGFVNGLTQYRGVINQLLTVIGKILTAAGPALASMIGDTLKLLEPLLAFLNSKAGKPFIDMLGTILAGFLAWKIASVALIDPLKNLAGIPGDISKAWTKANGVYMKIMGPGGTMERVTSGMGSVFSKLKGWGSSAFDGIASGGGKIITGLKSAGSAVAAFAADYASKIAAASAATVAWVAEHAAATAAFVAENIVQAASATAAFIAENAATLGIAAAIAALIAGAVYAATHWKQIWGDIKRWAEDAWHFIWDGFGKYLLPLLGPAGLIALGAVELAKHWQQIMTAIGDAASFLWHQVIQPAWQGIKTATEWLYNTGIKPQINLIIGAFRLLENAALWMWHNVFDPVWHGIEAGARAFVSGFETVWGRLESVFKNPVNFLIGTVYDKGIARLWNDVVGAIGLGSIKLPVIPTMAGGGIVPGTDQGRDTQIIAARPEEGILIPGAVRGIGGPAVIHALNRVFGGGGRNAPGHFAQGGVAGSKGGGGFLGGIGHFLSGIGHDILSGIGGAIDIAKIVAAVATGNTTAFINAAGKLIGTHAAGDLAKMMIGVPKTLVADAAKQLMSMFSSSAGGKLPTASSLVMGSLPQNWKTIAQFLATHGFTKFAAAGVAGNIAAESSGDPEILEAGGGGGGGLIQWTPYPAGYITGNYMHDLYTQLNAILHWGGGPGIVNRASSPSNAAAIYQDYYERPASLTASLPLRMASANAVYRQMGWGKFDGGGWLMPTNLMPGGVNTTTRPEAVLNPAESDAFVKFVRSLPSHGVTSANGVTVIQQFNGTQWPNVEQQAAMKREMALTLAGPG
jgi:hypothetical protein